MVSAHKKIISPGKVCNGNKPGISLKSRPECSKNIFDL